MARQNKAWQDETRQDENKARQGKTNKARQGKARHNKTNKARQGKNNTPRQDTTTHQGRQDNDNDKTTKDNMHHHQGPNRNCQLFFDCSIFLILHFDTNTCTFRLL
jgi:phage repressor protein C with HTH and peptisase S24 domain